MKGLKLRKSRKKYVFQYSLAPTENPVSIQCPGTEIFRITFARISPYYEQSHHYDFMFIELRCWIF